MSRWLLGLVALWFVPITAVGEPLRVFATGVPIQTFVGKLAVTDGRAGDGFRPGFNPRTYDPTPRQTADLSEADLYVRTGIPFETAWMDRLRAMLDPMGEARAPC